MDSKTIFTRTSKGEDEIRSETAHLSGDIKRSLLMVDGKATFGEINKRAAPSLRSSLEQMFKELIQDGFIQEKHNTAKISKRTAPSGMVPKMVVPSRKVTAHKMPEDDEGDNELDFASEYRDHSQEALPDEADNDESEAEAEAEAKAHALAQAKAKQEAEAKSRAEAEAQARAKAEAKAKAKREAEAKARQDAEANAPDEIEVQARALQEARELAEAKARQGSGLNDQAIAEAKARLEAEAIAKQEAEAKAIRDAEAKARAAIAAQERALEEARARVEAQAKARREAEATARAVAEEKARREAEEKARREAEEKARREAEEKARRVTEEKAKREAEAIARAKAEAQAQAEEQARWEADIEANSEQESEDAELKSENFQASRTTSATVLFFDVIGYTRQPVNKQIEIKKQFNRLVSDCLKKLGKSERIILDTGDGAAIGFLQHPEEALKVAMQFRNAVIANQHNDYPELKVRIGVHLGPISVVKDMNGLSNMVGDGINDAQRVMSFSGADQVYISRPYFDFISRLSSEYTGLFHYQGALPDKHGRDHPVYKLVDTAAPVAQGDSLQSDTDVTELKLDPFSFTFPGATESPGSTVARSGLGLRKDDVALMSDIGKFIQPEETKKSPAEKSSVQSEAQEVAPASEHSPEKTLSSETAKSEAKEQQPSASEVKKLEEAQAKVWAEAEQRAKEASKAKAVWDVDLPPESQPAVKKAAPVARVKRKPLPWNKLVAGTFAVVLILLFVAPFVMPTKEYVPGIEKLLSGKFHQPVHIGRLEGRLLPTPRLDLIDMAIGDNKQIKARLARLDFAIPALFTVVKSIDTLELEDVEVDAAALQQAAELLQQAATDIDFPIARILLKKGNLETEGFKLSGVGGEINFNQAGKFSRAKLYAEGNKYELELESAPLYKTRVSISVHGSALPLLPNWVFDNLTAKGVMAGSELVITELDGHIMGGTLLGNFRLEWRSGWRVQGSLVAKAITMQNMLKVLSGDMDGTARFQMQAASLVKLADAASLDGSFVIKNGVINGIDIAETARLHRTENMPGGRTHFDELSGELSYDKDAYAFRKLKLSASVLAAKGTLDYSGQQVAGSITAELDLHEGIGPVSLELRGTRDNPTLGAR